VSIFVRGSKMMEGWDTDKAMTYVQTTNDQEHGNDYGLAASASVDIVNFV
jgi:hypothetical protein